MSLSNFLADANFTAFEIAFFLNLVLLPYLLLLSPIIGGIKATLRTEHLWLHVLCAMLGVISFAIVVATFHVAGGLLTARAFSMAETAIVASFHYVQLLWGTAFGFVFFTQVPDMWTLIGAVIIVFSGVYMIYREHVRDQHISSAVTVHGQLEQE